MDSKHGSRDEFDSGEQLESRISDLCSRLQDELITTEEVEELNALLESSSIARKYYLRCILLNQMLVDGIERQNRLEAEILGTHVDFSDQKQLPRQPLAKKSASGNPGALGAIKSKFMGITLVTAAILLIAIVSAAGIRLASPNPSARVTSDRIASDDEAGLIRLGGRTQPALVSFVSASVRWGPPGRTLSSGARVVENQDLRFDEGAVELTYDSGAKLLLVAPVDFTVRIGGGELRRGGVVASVPEAGQGFTIKTPNGRVVDLGTEFGLAVDDFGVSEVSVFEGKVEAFPITDQYDGNSKVELLKGDGLQWKHDGMVELDADLRRFATSRLDATLDSPGKSYFDRFREAIDPNRWQTIGNVSQSGTGLRLKSASSSERPYLISAKQFDPLDGPITVTCDFRFLDFGATEKPGISILTRSAAQRGTARPPWDGMLASCVCCSFGKEDATQERVLQTSVKLGAENQMSSVSWGGFLRPVPNTRYRLVMHDDGVNVSFTVSDSENPSIRKTVSCRSLFRNETNYIALGGMADASIEIDRVEIQQDKLATPLATYREFCALLSDDSTQREHEIELLDGLTPKDADLVISEAFDLGELDTTKWQTLGDVSIDGGRLLLGASNVEGKIDTWRARPYLLTSMPMNPSEGTITIVGRLSFADNYLTGYGATFAVVTRANEKWGDVGHGWENSTVQSCVRMTFWPASADNRHSLEIHEKPQPNTVTLLATQSADIDPFVKNYLFKVVDDGKTVSLTIVDPQNPSKLLTVESRTSNSLSSGFVGFESCWGSPIVLEDIRIFRATK